MKRGLLLDLLSHIFIYTVKLYFLAMFPTYTNLHTSLYEVYVEIIPEQKQYQLYPFLLIC